MNWDVIQGSWKELKGSARQEWGRLTDDELEVIAGQRDKLEGAIQKAYGKSRDEAHREVENWMSRHKK